MTAKKKNTDAVSFSLPVKQMESFAYVLREYTAFVPNVVAMQIEYDPVSWMLTVTTENKDGHIELYHINYEGRILEDEYQD